MLHVRCKDCGHAFATGISIGFAGRPVLGIHAYTCPECGAEYEYEGEDYFEPQEPEAR